MGGLGGRLLRRGPSRPNALQRAEPIEPEADTPPLEHLDLHVTETASAVATRPSTTVPAPNCREILLKNVLSKGAIPSTSRAHRSAGHSAARSGDMRARAACGSETKSGTKDRAKARLSADKLRTGQTIRPPRPPNPATASAMIGEGFSARQPTSL